MTTILRLDSSVRHNDSSQQSHHSISKQLGDVFIQTWLEHLPDTNIIHRDLSQNPPSFIRRLWQDRVLRA